MKPPKRLRVTLSKGKIVMDVTCNSQLIGNVYTKREVTWVDYDSIAFELGKKHDAKVDNQLPDYLRQEKDRGKKVSKTKICRLNGMPELEVHYDYHPAQPESLTDPSFIADVTINSALLINGDLTQDLLPSMSKHGVLCLEEQLLED